MKFEKLTENKIRITLNLDDLAAKNIDFHSFMSNSSEAQSLFLDMLKEAEEEIGFITKDYKIMIEALAMADGHFVLTVTRALPTNFVEKEIVKRKVRTKRKTVALNEKSVIYRFSCFDNFCDFSTSLSTPVLKKLNSLFSRITLFSYQSAYYLVLVPTFKDNVLLKHFYSSISEFSSYIKNSELFERKLAECGSIIIKDKAIHKCVKYFATK